MLWNFKKRREHNSRGVVVENSVKALLVGINYTASRNALGSCINDVLITRRNILSEYPNAYVELITDDTLVKPTRDNIFNGLTTLVSTANHGDTLMFHYSGHSSQIPNFYDYEEDSISKETICPIDFMEPRILGFGYKVDSQITYDEILNIILNVPAEVNFLMLSDCCRSDAIRDLKYDPAHYDSPNDWSALRDVKQQACSLTSTHTHHIDGGRKLTLNMCSCGTCGGRELRIMRGYVENQTSANTSKYFWKTVQDIGGLRNFFPKLFSHNVEDLKYVQDSINRNLAEYSQRYMKSPTVIHWEHAWKPKPF